MQSPLLAWGSVDAKDNGERQIVLVDADHLVGVDSQGLPVPGFMVDPDVDITAAAIVDYDSNGRERYLIGLADGSLLNHRETGEETPGWNHKSRGSAVQIVQHLRVGEKDYLCTVDAAGTVMLLKRNGKRRTATPAQLTPKEGYRTVVFDLSTDISQSTLTAEGSGGAIVRVSFGSGAVQALSESESSNWASSLAPAMPTWLEITSEGPARRVD